MKIEKRKLKLQKLLLKIEGGEDIALRELKSVLTDDEYLQFEDMWESEQNKRAIQKPDEIKKYELLLKKAMFADSNCDSYSERRIKRSISGQQKLNISSEIAFSRALECLEEIVGSKSNLNIWLDRSICFDAKKVPTSVWDLPRIVTSRGHYVESHGFKSTYTKREIKTQILKDALDSIENPLPLVSEEEQLNELKKMISVTKSQLHQKPKSKSHGIKV